MAVIGGVLLIIAAFLMYQSHIYYASMAYILADFVWISLGYFSGDWIGTILIIIGATLNLGVFIKMHKNTFVRNLKKEHNGHNGQ